MKEKIENKFKNPRLQEAYELYRRSIKRLNEDISDEFIVELFNSTLFRCEVGGHIKL